MQFHVFEQAGIKKLEKMVHKWSHGSKWQTGVEGKYFEIINGEKVNGFNDQKIFNNYVHTDIFQMIISMYYLNFLMIK